MSAVMSSAALDSAVGSHDSRSIDELDVAICRSLHGGIGRADLPIDTVKRLTCDGSLVTVLEDDHGGPLDVGRRQRTVPTPLKRALYSRDRSCTFPGCERKRYLDALHR